MAKSSGGILSAVLALAALALSSACRADGLSAEQRRQDPRLSRKITLSARRIYVGKLLEEMSQQSRVALRPGSEKDGAADFRVAVSLSSVTLGDAMDALWSLMSYRGAGWEWRRRETARGLEYELFRPLQARLLPQRLGQQRQAMFEAHAARMMEAASASPGERARMAKRDPIIKHCLKDERVWGNVRTFAENVPVEQRLAVLRGRELKVSVSDLTPAGRAYVEGEVSLRNRLRATVGGSPVRPPEWIQFSQGGGSLLVTPTLFVLLDGLGGFGAFGGVPLHRQFVREQLDLWMLPGDEARDPAEQRAIPVPVGAEKDEAPPKTAQRLEFRLEQVARALPLSFLALLPEETRDCGSPYGSRLGGFLERLVEDPPETHHKWRGGILLLSHPSWFWASLGNVPWSVMKSLAAARQRSGGVLTLPDLWPAVELMEPQLEVLSHTFPEARAVEDWRRFLIAIQRRPKLWEELTAGAGVRPGAVLQLLAPGLTAQLGDLTRASSLHMVTEEHLGEKPPWRLYLLQARSRDGKVLGTCGLRLQGAGGG